MIENFIGTKSWRKILEGLKRKVGIFIRTKNIFNPKKIHKYFVLETVPLYSSAPFCMYM